MTALPNGVSRSSRRDGIRFLLDERLVTLDAVDPNMTVLEWLRREARRTGTKEGCAEGDCGACTVVVGALDDASPGGLRYRAVNACILFVSALDGKQLLTVEDLREPDGALHPVQQAMVDHHASQCGFCTPGFVMSVFALGHQGGSVDGEAIHDALAGNLCRCTGYRPILAAAAEAVGPTARDRFAERTADTAAKLEGLRDDATVRLAGAGRQAFVPKTLAALEDLLTRYPQARLVAGGTDVGLWVTKQHRKLDPVIHINEVRDLQVVTQADAVLSIGAAVPYTDCLPVLTQWVPSFAALIRRLGSTQIRNSGTMVGNIANGSPIGDSMPALIALEAELVLNRGGERSIVALEDFYTGYRQTVLEPGSFVESVRIPIRSDERWRFATYKVSKRRDQDISAVAVGFALILEGGRVIRFRAAYGGMAATPKRARSVEDAILGRAWNMETVRAAMAAVEHDFSPLTDMRAGSTYRLIVARNLLLRFYLETTGQTEQEDIAHG